MKTVNSILFIFLFTGSLYSQNNGSTLELKNNRFEYHENLNIEAFTPIVQINNEFYDTVNVFDFSKAMTELGQRNLYLSPTQHDIIRLSRFTHNKATVIIVRKLQHEIELNLVSSSSDYFNLHNLTISKHKSLLSLSELNKLINDLEDFGFWDLNDDSMVVPREYIFESIIEGEYYFKYKGEIDLSDKKKNKKLIKLFDVLEKRILKNTTANNG